MPSPFPGMDPYLEEPSRWADVHSNLTDTIRRRLNATLPPGYAARVDRHVWIHEPTAAERLRVGRPDVYATGLTATPAATAAVGPLVAPNLVVLPLVPTTGPKFLRIVDATGQRVVTALEILSPANKANGPDRDAYLSKRLDYLSGGLNFVEIDLLRVGQRSPMGDPRPADYYCLVCWAHALPNAGVWPVGLRDPLPKVPVPLDPGRDEVMLDLQSCLAEVYDVGRYAAEIDYDRPPTPPLHEPDATWARERLDTQPKA